MTDAGTLAQAAWKEHYKYLRGRHHSPDLIGTMKAAFLFGWKEATESAEDMPSFEHMEAVAKLSALRRAQYEEPIYD